MMDVIVGAVKAVVASSGPDMKITQAKREEHREKLLAAASALFRKHGFEGVTVADVTAAAGLTHGAFYNHFDSKEALLAEAASCALDAATREVSALRAAGKRRSAYAKLYLGDEHLRDASTGCAIVALAPEVARRDLQAKHSFAAALRRLLASLSDGASSESDDDAVVDMCTLAGALLIARAVAGADDALAHQVRAAVRHRVTGPEAPPKPKQDGRTRAKRGRA
jgi:TetR/AcrR family transcriptional repressor of nem operon